MDDRTENEWRAALQQRGKEWVMSQLRTRPGRPDDAVYDVVFEAPYPTRAFCVQWCAEQDNKLFRLSWHTYTAIAILLLVVVCFWQAVGSWNEHALMAARHLDASLHAAPDQVGSTPSDFSVAIPNANPLSVSDGSSSGSSSTRSTPPSLCSYLTYNTTRCPPQQR